MSVDPEVATLYSALDDLKSLGLIQFGAKDFCVRALSRAYFAQISECVGSAAFNAITSIGCSPSADYSKTRSCAACHDLYAISKPPEGSEFARGVDHVCRIFCTACVVENVERSANVRLDVTCNPSASMRTSIESDLDQLLEGKTNLLAQRYSALSATNLKSAKSKLSATIDAAFTTEIADTVRQGILAYQRLTVSPSSESVLVQNLKQSINVDVLASIMDQALADTQFVSTVVAADGGPMDPVKARDTTETLSGLLRQLTTRLVIVGIGVLLLVAVGLVAFLVRNRGA
jgi:hypothetical protein